MHGDDLHGVGVGLEPAAALLARVAAGVDDAVLQPLDQRRRAELPLDGGRVQRLGDVPQVGEQALARRCGPAAGR